ncbi:MAG: DEAD/DEAH box helicase family protein [Candidatus Hadarchaeales archaeon]
MIVDNPILNSPFEEPTRYWAYEEGQPVLKEGRRPAGYYLKARTRGPQTALLEEEFVPLELVNALRGRVKAWREQSYPGVTPLTRQLLHHWNNPERERKLFFCQREAAETLIWLIEALPAEKQGIAIPKDNGLTRYACKMATGSGKTVVMAMMIAWQVLKNSPILRIVVSPMRSLWCAQTSRSKSACRSSCRGSRETTTKGSTLFRAVC